MIIRRVFVVCLMLLTYVLAQAPQTTQDQVLEATPNWLKNASKGDRAALNSIMDARFIATTPAGDVLTKERLVPDDEAQAVQQLPPMEVDGPLVRIYGDTAIVMSRLKVTDGNQLNGTFVYRSHDSRWKLVAMHLSLLK